ncbi:MULTISPECIES: peptide deformylase [Auritidibacter]|uniref:Peptide deformylase n=1 Tax=Auritidibacter ignavus TaxID=678932 RepID=A0AAJ6DCN0_9MICC|nr:MULTISPECIES: peptide deformylase [Auritidibacter]PXA77716.1 peptide deformylase [Auritidibacter sp. NML100628]WGH84292.1 peptide deformylase [Auritidibacter ignavus]WGH93614.1 peptide deformylase [Auritidibacter ignavus]WHS28027.1 peptide deformylase [Auritidibacter ignavus]
MTVLALRTVPDPVLKTACREVDSARFGTDKLRRLITDMMETMQAVDGVGLAGPQVGVSQSLFVFDVEGRQGHVINPVLEVSGDVLYEPSEGCLSVPGLFYAPPRRAEATVTGLNTEGQAVTYHGHGLFARMLQHETDHLTGHLFVDRLQGEQRHQARRAMNTKQFKADTAQTQHQRAEQIGSAFMREGHSAGPHLAPSLKQHTPGGKRG